MNCCFCEEMKTPCDNSFYNTIGVKYNLYNRIIYESEHWVVVPTIGCLNIGYVMLVSKRHYSCLATTPYKYYNEMIIIQDEIIKQIMLRLGTNCVVFEHGVKSTKYKGANSVDHTHIHIVPLLNNIWTNICMNYDIKDYHKLDDQMQILSYIHTIKPNSYLYFRDINCINYLVPNANTFPSQFFRMVLAKELKIDDKWDWRLYPFEDNVINTLQLLKGTLFTK